MTTSNRFLNRLFLVVTGLIVLAVGAALVLSTLPAAASARRLLDQARTAQDTALRDTRASLGGGLGIGTADGSWLPLLLALVCLVVVIVALVAIVTRGRGRTDRILEADGPAGTIVVGSRFAETALEGALSGRRDVVGVSVASYRLRGAAAIKIRVRLAAGSEPAPVIEAASRAASGLDRVLGGGARVPVLVEIVGASPARAGSDSRVR